MAYVQDRSAITSSPGTPPSLYDTSTSTADDSFFSTPMRHSTPNDRTTQGTAHLHTTATYSTTTKRFPRIRKTVSEPGTSTQQHLQTTSSMQDRGDPTALKFMDDYDYHYHNDPMASQDEGNEDQDGNHDDDHDHDDDSDGNDPVTQARQLHSPKQPRRKKRSHPKYYGDVRSKFEALRKASGQDPNESFESSVETPTTSSIQELKRQLWNDREELQIGRLDQKFTPPKIPLNNTFDSDNTASFKSKYYEAAIRGRDSNNSHGEDDDRKTTSRPRTKSRGEETQVSAYSTPNDEGGRPKLARNHYVARDVSPLHTPRESPNDPPPRYEPPTPRSTTTKYPSEDQGQQKESETMRVRPVSQTRDPLPMIPRARARSPSLDGTRKESGRPRAQSVSRTRDQPFSTSTLHGRPPSPSMQDRDRGRQLEVLTTRASSNPRTRDNSVEARGRAPLSPLIQQRIREISQEQRGHPETSTQSSNRRKIAVESSFEVLAREFGKELQAAEAAGELYLSNLDSCIPYGSEKKLPDHTIRRITTIKDAPAERSASFERRPPTPINTLIPDSPSLEEPSFTEEARQKQHADVATYWKEKARSSPTCPMPDGPVAFMNHSSDYGDRIHGSQGRSSEAGSSSAERQVADLVAKLSAVKRDNPAEALALIDSILRQESRNNSIETDNQGLSKGHREFPDTLGDEEMEKHGDTDSDDDTSVSELTNPTFQGSVKSFRDEVRILSQAYPEINSNPQTPVALSTSSFRRPRPSALQNYIPSNLPSDVTPRHIPEEGRIKSKERREEAKINLPLSTIKVKDAHDPRSPSPIPHDDRPRGTHSQKIPGQGSHSFEDHVRVTITQQTTNATREHIQERKGKRNTTETANELISDQEVLAAKIRDWDDMSHGKEKPTSEKKNFRMQEKQRDDQQTFHHSGTLPTVPKTHRAHPWDGEIPTRIEKIETRDTSMENGAGVEVAIPQRRDVSSDEGLSSSFEVSRADEQRSPKAKHFAKKVDRDRSLIEAFPDDSALYYDSSRHEEEEYHSRAKQSAESLAAQTPVHRRQIASPHATRTPNQRQSRVSPQVARNPFEKQPVTSLRSDRQSVLRQPSLSPRRRTSPVRRQPSVPSQDVQRSKPRTGVDAWSPLQANDLFPEIPLFSEHDITSKTEPTKTRLHPPLSDTPQTNGSKRRSGPVDTDESFDTIYSMQRAVPTSCLSVWKNSNNRSKDDVERGAIEVSLVSGEEDGDFLDTSGDTGTSGSLEQHKSRQVGKGTTEDNGTTKNKRRGFLRAFIRKDKKKTTQFISKPELRSPSTAQVGGALPSSNSSDRPVPQVLLQPVLPAFYPEAPATIGRGRDHHGYASTTPQRSRSASLERFRSRNMAQKFGRVMSLYDKE